MNENGQPDALTPAARADGEYAMMGKFSTPGGIQILELLDQPEQLIEWAESRKHELSCAEVLLSQILATMTRDARSGGDRARYLPISQASPGYTLITAPPSANQCVEIVVAAITLDAAGTLAFLQGSGPGAATDATLSGAFPLATNGGFILPPTPRTDEPWLAASPGLTVGINTATGRAFGFVGYRYAQL